MTDFNKSIIKQLVGMVLAGLAILGLCDLAGFRDWRLTGLIFSYIVVMFLFWRLSGSPRK